MPTRLISRFFRFILRLTAAASLLMLSACALPNLGTIREALNKAATPEPAVEGVEAEQAAEPSAPLEAPAADPVTALGGSFRELSAADFSAESDAQPGLILFNSTAEQPFTRLNVSGLGTPEVGGQVWAVAPDGERAGLVSPPETGGALLPSAFAGVKTQLLGLGVSLIHPAVDLADAPQECLDATAACGSFQFSADGRFMAYLSGEEDCGRTLTVIERASQKTMRAIANTRWAYFNQDSTLMLASGNCDSPRVQAGIYIPHTDTYSGTGFDGDAYWNANHSAVLIQARDLVGFRAALWGFHLETGRIFMWMDDKSVMEDAPTWADPENFLFGHRKIRYDGDGHELVIEGPLQIVSMNAKTRTQRLLTYDGANDYHLCVEDGVPCQEWYGEWLQVKRTPFQPQVIKVDPTTGELEDRPATRCALYGYDCQKPAELFALNWKTGELLPWDEAGLPALPDRRADPGPDFNAGPVYADPNGEFSFYPGLDGRSLWRVPSNGDPEQWVKDGYGFVYLP